MFKAKTELRILQYFYYRGTEAKAEKKEVEKCHISDTHVHLFR